MASAAVDDLQNLWQSRSTFFGDDHALMDDMITLYNGGMLDEFDDYFPQDMHIHVPNMIRLSWDDLTAMSGKVFPIYVKPDNDTPTAKSRAEKLEQIGYGYNEAGQTVGAVSMKMLMQVFSWWMIGCANAVGIVQPSFKYKTPYFSFRDPRSYYPPIGWTPYTQSDPIDGLFAYQMTIGELKARYPHSRDELSTKLQSGKYAMGSGFYGGRSMTDEEPVWVGEYYHEDSWLLATLTDEMVTILRSDTGDKGHPGVQPVVPMGLYSPQGPKGRSMFADQGSIQAALARMFSQKLDYFDATLYPLIFHTPVSGNTVKMGPYATNEYVVTTGITPKVDTVAPAHPIDADQTMQFVIGLSRMLNRNPEQMQGAGQADSAKALNELKSGITTTIRDGFWPPIVEAMPKMYRKAAQMDLNIWPHERRVSSGRRKNSEFTVNYVPASDLIDRENSFKVEPGLGLAGYQGTVEILQLLGAESISEDTALEQLEHVREPQAEKRRIFVDRMQKVSFATLAAQAQQGALAPGALAAIIQRVNEGEDGYDVIADMEEKGLLMAPPPPMPEMGGAPGAPGGGGAPNLGAVQMPTPSLGAIQQMARRG